MSISAFQSEQLLAAAFDALFAFVVSMPQTGNKEDDAPVFSYLLTPKQKDQIDRVCSENGWPQINCLGILINVDAVRHPLTTRRAKDRISDDEIRQIIQKAYSARSLIRVNR